MKLKLLLYLSLKKWKKNLEFLLEQQVEEDSTDGAFDFLDNLTNRLQEDFDEIIGGDAEKKSFIRSLMRIFALLWNTKVDSVNKIKRTATRWPRTSRAPPWLMKKRRQRKVKRPFKMKVTLPEQKDCRH